MTNRDFKRAILEVRADFAKVEMPAAAASRVWRRHARPAPRLPRAQVAWLAVAAAGAGALAAAFALHGHRARPVVSLPDGFEVVAGSEPGGLVRAGGAGEVVAGGAPATLHVRAWGRVTLHAGARLRRAPDGVELVGGDADFEVDKRPPGAATFVHLAGGSIEITGTRFSVETRLGGGAVRLDEGAIRFHAPDGRTVALAPGQVLRWPLPAAAEPVPPPGATSASERRDRPPRADPARPIAARSVDDISDADAVVDRIAVLRAAGRYGDLADELRLAASHARRPLTRERLSFELGEVLSFHLPDGARACAHWADHVRAFPAGHYADEVSEARRILGCDTKGDGR
jgi:hypothetical protein